MINSRILPVLILGLIMSAVFSTPASADRRVLEYDDENVVMRIIVRTPDQLTAFYQGRKFKQNAVDAILSTCVITPLIKNRTYDYLWLELDLWKFEANGKPVKRLDRSYWQNRWQQVGLKTAHQSTFGWTLLPEARDLRLDEGVGGSVTLPMQSAPFKVIANFPTGENKQGPVKQIVFEDVTCQQN
jgi:hypothetical protein